MPLRILIVDDCDDSARMLAMLLRLEAHAVDIAYDGPEALQTATERPPDVVLLDLSLPGMSGPEVARALRLLPSLEHTALAAFSGYALDPSSPDASAFDAHFEKPLKLPALQDFLRRCANTHTRSTAP